MSLEPSFDELMSRLRAGNDNAAAAVFAMYARRLAGLARQRLSGRLAGKVDADDVLQSAFRSFFRRHANGDFEIHDWDGMWSLLTLITLRKCGRQVDYFYAARRSVTREVGELPNSDSSIASCEAIAREPRPEEAAMLTETVEQLLAELSRRDRNIVTRTLQGDTSDQIAPDEGCSERTVERVRARLRERLESMCEAT